MYALADLLCPAWHAVCCVMLLCVFWCRAAVFEANKRMLIHRMDRCYDSPCVLLQDTFEGVQSIASGGEASAVVDRAGKLWMWGLVAESTDPSSRLPGPKTVYGREPAPCVSKHEKNPLVVPDLDPVTDVALGKNHVLAVTSAS